MSNTTARIRKDGKNFEILVDLDKALQLREGKNVSITEAVETNAIFSDLKKGFHVSASDLQKAFSTSDVYAVADIIIKKGEILFPQEYRKKEQGEKVKQIIDFLSRNAIDPRTNKPHTAERIANAIEQAGVNIENRPIEEQISKIIEKIRAVLPIKLETKKIKITIPAVHTGKVYGLLQGYKETEEWISDGSLKCIVNLPAGIQMDFYDKLNAITHGSALTEEMKE